MKDEDILEELRDRYKTATQGWDHIYEEVTNDLKFVYDIEGGQWPESIRTARENDKRPVITGNKLLKFVRQLRGDFLQNRPRMKIVPVDNKADVKMAEIYNGLVRQIEYLSDASIAYDTGYMHATSSSVGYFRIISKYADDDSFDQDLYIERIINNLSVHYDPAAIKFNYEDAKYCFIEELVSKKDFERQYPGAEFTNFDSHKALFGEWIQGENIRVAEYFYKSPVEKTIVQMTSGKIHELTEAVTRESLQSEGDIILRERKVDAYEIKWCKTNGYEILKKGDWPGKYIPIIPVLGDEIVVDGKRHYLSLIRGAKGQQEMYNYWATAATETVALAPKMPFIVDHKQIAGFENEWEEANITNRMFIRYNAIQGIEKPTRERQTEIPGAIISMMQTTAFDIEDHLGRYEASKGQASNERSGKAIIARIQQADKGSYVYVDNGTRSIIYGTRQLIDLIPKIYDTQRALRIRGENDEEQIVDVNIPAADAEGNFTLMNDLSVGKYDLIATVGASFSSKRQEMVEMLIESMQYAPQLAVVIAPLIFKYADFPGAEEVYAEIKKAIENMPKQPSESAK